MRDMFRSTSGGKAGAIDGLNLFFGALLGANLGSIQGMTLPYYVELISSESPLRSQSGSPSSSSRSFRQCAIRPRAEAQDASAKASAPPTSAAVSNREASCQARLRSISYSIEIPS